MEKIINSYNKFAQKKKLIKDIKKLQKIREDINNGVDIKKKIKPKKIKTFDEYFQECIKNKTIPSDTPPYLRKALERAIKKHNQGIIKEKSALEGFVNKYKREK